LQIQEEITSPTYTIISEYEAILPSKEKVAFYHIDAYRLEGDDDFAAMGGEEYFGKNSITVVEWGEKIKKSLPAGTIYAEIEILDGNSRCIRVGSWK
jgi:tRNA threonylcarbamoyladenosine biosynthesis protein TsaE